MTLSKSFKMFFVFSLIGIFIASVSTKSHTCRAPMKNDLAKDYFNTPYVNDLDIFPLEKTSTPTPWSGYYWPLVKGGIGYRYGDSAIQVYDQPLDHNLKYGAPNFAAYVNENYSPSEKYDFLVGDYEYTLTNLVRYKMNKAFSWEGISHGWAAASTLEPRPEKNVEMMASDGKTKIIFYPDDIKALISQYYATAIYYNHLNFLGTKCKRYAGPNGAVLKDPACYDNNPATFFLVIANQIGLRTGKVLFDQPAEYEVWNFPAYKYAIKYFNPLNNLIVTNLKDGKISLLQARKASRPFLREAAENSAKGTRYLLGVNLIVDYMSETQPKRDAPNPDVLGVTEFTMILELNGANQVIGGSWTSNIHPDYIWKFDEMFTIKKDRYDSITSFTGNWWELFNMTKVAQKVSGDRQVIYEVVKYLLNQSKI